MNDYSIVVYAAPAIVGLIALVVGRISLRRLRDKNRRRAVAEPRIGKPDALISRKDAIAALASLRRPGDFPKASE